MSNNSTVDYYIAPRGSFEATADAIRAVNGSTADITWGQDGFADIIGNVRKYTADNILGNSMTGDIVYTGTSFKSCSLSYQTGITSITAENVTSINDSVFQLFRGCTGLTNIYMPKLTSIYNGSYFFAGCTSLTSITNANFPKLNRMYNTSMFEGCTGLTLFCIPALGTANSSVKYMAGNTFKGCTNLETVDMASFNRITANTFLNCAKLNILILRNTSSVFTLDNVNAFSGTPYASGKSGGTIYIPKTLYDQLGSGTTNKDYKAATNWSTLDGYGTVTWAKIEGSYYETHYADGTPIGGAS